MVRRSLLICGLVAMLWYAAMTIVVPTQYDGYNSLSQSISELSAIDAPTRTLWIVLGIFYFILFIAFGLGTWLSANGNRKLQIVAIIIVFDAVFGIFWPPMHQREVIAAGGGTVTDTLHIVWAFVHLVLMLLMIGFGASVFGKDFRIFSAAIVLVFIVFGILTTIDSRRIKGNFPTPFLGLWERINIATYMIWVIVFASRRLKRNNQLASKVTFFDSTVKKDPYADCYNNHSVFCCLPGCCGSAAKHIVFYTAALARSGFMDLEIICIGIIAFICLNWLVWHYRRAGNQFFLY